MTNPTNWPSLSIPLLLAALILHKIGLNFPYAAVCELSYRDRNKLYNYSLASPVRKFPHGVLSEDGFYKVAVNETVLWFQLCDLMLFSHDPPTCGDCGSSSHCGMGCSALASNIIGGYPVCNAIGHLTSTIVFPMDITKPHIGVIVKMSNSEPRLNCSLSVAVVCDYNGFQGPQTLEKTGTCDYATQLRHPAGCATVISGWVVAFQTFRNIVAHAFRFFLRTLCLFVAYLLAGVVYRYFVLNIRGIDMIPNLEFWVSLPHRVQSSLTSLARRFRGPSEGYRSSYSPVDF